MSARYVLPCVDGNPVVEMTLSAWSPLLDDGVTGVVADDEMEPFVISCLPVDIVIEVDSLPLVMLDVVTAKVVEVVVLPEIALDVGDAEDDDVLSVDMLENVRLLEVFVITVVIGE